MNGQLVAILALIAAANARIEGMKATNIERQANGYALAYDEQAFVDEAIALAELARDASRLA